MPTSIPDLCNLFISTCSNKSMVKHISAYSVTINATEESLTAARTQYREQTDSIVKHFQDMNSIHQIATSIRHCSVEVQYFIFERANLIKSMATRYPDKYPITVDPNVSICHQISLMLLSLWEYTEMLCQNHLNSAVSQSYKESF